MRTNITLVFVSALIFLSVHSTHAPRLKNFYKTEEEHQQNLENYQKCSDDLVIVNNSVINTKDDHHVRHRHGEEYKIKKLSRCRRYAYNYYRDYTIKSNCYYTWCRPYCSYCPTRQCRRRCPYGNNPCPNIAITTPLPPPTERSRTCDCDPQGSQFSSCDSVGQCRCKVHYTGLKCDRCEDDYWKDRSSGCVPCNCNPEGSKSTKCQEESGFCHCKNGVGGQKCDMCLPHHYGNLTLGCKECDPCDKPGHICHQQTGKCVCPPLTTGAKCEKCVENTWGYEPGLGCKSCDCSPIGSSKTQCDLVSGRCTCKIGFEGEKCDRCSYGYYGSKNCKKCNCDRGGTLPEDCGLDSCRCSEHGCRCKANVEGKNCDTCKKGTFGVNQENSLGCTDCFCFGRSKLCRVANYTWDQIRTTEVLPDFCDNIACWTVPRFTGDLTSSYGGYVRVYTNSALPSFYKIYLTGNGITLEASAKEPDVQILENFWKLKSNKNPTQLPNTCSRSLTRPCLMIALQNVTKVQIEPGPTLRSSIQFTEVLLDKATNIPGTLQASYIERCECPKEYTSPSCQDPNNGYFRYFPKKGETTNYIDSIVGVARRCQCNNRSNMCDKQTGHCFNCTSFTAGPHCESCAEGFYKDISGSCKPCLCPSEKQNNAISCKTGGKFNNQFKCECKRGYKGIRCDECDDGFWGNPKRDEPCLPCNCNSYGSKHLVCNKATGQCSCKPGFTGLRCSECLSPREVIQNGICTPCDECTQILFNTIDTLTEGLNTTLDLFKDGLGPPWPVLNETLYRYNLLSDKFDNEIDEANKLLQEANIPELKSKVNRMKKDLNKKNQVVSRQMKSIDALYKNSKDITKEVKLLYDKIDEIIKNLDNFGTSHVDTQDALRQAKKILNEINEKVKTVPTTKDYEDLFRKCDALLKRINKIYNDTDLNPDKLKSELNELKKRIRNLNVLLDQTDATNKLARNKNKQNSNRIAKLNQTIIELNTKTHTINNGLTELLNKIDNTNDILNEIEKIYKILTEVNLQSLTNKIKTGNSTDKLYDTLIAVRDHVNDLQNKIQTYKSLFNFTTDEWKKINASGSYDNLVKSIEKAREKAEEAKKFVEDTVSLLYPDDDDSLPDKTNLAKALSDRLQHRINNLKNPASEFKKVKEDLEKLKYDILNNGRNNNDLITVLINMQEQIKQQSSKVNDLEKVGEDAREISEKMASIEKQIKDMNISTQYELVKPHLKYLNLTSNEEILKLMDKIKLTKVELQKSYVNFTKFDEIININYNRFHNNDKNLNTFSDKLNQLKNKIRYASEAAEAVNIAISIHQCARHYNMKKDVFKSLSITFNCNDCMLFNLTNRNHDILSLNVKNNIVHFRWRNVMLKTTEQLSSKTNTVTVLRTGPQIYFEAEGKRIGSIYDPKLFKIDEGDWLKVGTLKGKDRACLHKINLNDEILGLWKFAKTKGDCVGCQKDVTITGQDVLFNGNGYRNVTGAKNFDPKQWAIVFSFRTFDENSLIFLARDKTNPCSYVALNLVDGHLNFKVRHVDGTNVTILSNKTYNDGTNKTVEISMEYDTGQQSYNLGSSDEGTIPRNKELVAGNVYKIRKSEIFIGGVSSILDRTCLDVDTSSFLGYLSSTNTPQFDNPTLTISYNIRLKSGELEFYKAWFSGQGFLQLDLSKSNIQLPLSVNFLVRPNGTNGFVVNIASLMDVFIKNNNLGIKVDNKEYSVEEDLQVFNVVNLNISNNKVIVTVNDQTKTVNFDSSLTEELLQELYFGQDEKKKYPNYNGGISDLSINSKIIPFSAETVKDFSKVQIGRAWPEMSSSVTMRDSFATSVDTSGIKEMQNTEGCPQIANYETDPDAVKFGDKPNSFIFIENSFWKKDYVIELQFRTFYPNGLIFLSTGVREQKHYNILEIKEGKLKLRMKGKRLKTIAIPERINDGMWHEIQIKQAGIKKKRKLTVTVDGASKKPMRMPRNNVRGELYVGGVPDNFHDYSELRNELHPFRGCMRSLKINNNLQVLVKNKKTVSYNNIGQCFPKVEKGAYFGGDAYAIYKSDFKVNKILELNFEFRTVEQNGILLSVSNYGNSPALSVELQNGAVVMTIDMGNGAVSNVTNNLDSDFTLCNNRWHNLTALYSSSELTVNVDGIRKSWVQSDLNSLMDEIEAPLYVGGLPDNAPSGTLKIKENFKGCIRNLKIENNLMDWTDMKELNNVLLNACPVVNDV